MDLAPTHHVFSFPALSYRAVVLGLQTAVVLRQSAKVALGDQLVFRSCRPTERLGERQFTGAWCCRKVTHIAPAYEDGRGDLYWDAGVQPGFAVFSWNTSAENGSAADRVQRWLTVAVVDGQTEEQFWEALHRRETARRELLRGTG